MPEINYLAVGAAAVAAVVAAVAYYAVLGNKLKEFGSAGDPDNAPPWMLPVELVKHLVLATVVAGVATKMGIDSWAGGLVLGVVLFVGFPAVLTVSMIVHEKTPWKLASLHLGDWLIKLLLIGAIVGAWH